MLFYVRRLIKDFRRTWGLVISAAIFFLVLALSATYFATYTHAEAKLGTLSAAPPRTPLAFIRMIDPREKIGMDAGPGDLGLSVPGVKVLYARLSHDPNMFLNFSTNELLTGPGTYIPHISQDLPVLVGAGSPWLKDADPRAGVQDHSGGFRMWGSLDRAYPPNPTISNTHIDTKMVFQVSPSTAGMTYVDGTGRVRGQDTPATLLVDPATAKSLQGWAFMRPSWFVHSFTCYCQSSELSTVVKSMNQAEEQAQTGRFYYAQDYADFHTPVVRSQAASSTLSTLYAVGVFLAAACVLWVLARVYWLRNRSAYKAESLSGAPEILLQLRQQTLIVFSAGIPVLVGFAVVNFLVSTTSYPPPLPPMAWLVVVGVVVLIQVLAALPTARSIRKMCRVLPAKGARP